MVLLELSAKRPQVVSNLGTLQFKLTDPHLIGRGV